MKNRTVFLVLVISIVLAALLVALGSGCSSDGNEGSALVDDATALIDDINSAITESDRAALETLYTTDARVTEQSYPTLVGIDQVKTQAPEVAGTRTVERSAPVSAYEDFATTFNVAKDSGESWTWLTIYQIEDGKVAAQWMFTLPFSP